MSDTGKKGHRTLYNGDQRSSQKFLAITANSSTPTQCNTQSATSSSSHFRMIGLSELTYNNNALTDALASVRVSMCP
jgi:hypothetical protein